MPTFCGITTNAGKARIQGVEFEGNARVFGNPGGPRLNFGWSLGYLDAKFKEFMTIVVRERSARSRSRDRSTCRSPQDPEHAQMDGERHA